MSEVKKEKEFKESPFIRYNKELEKFLRKSVEVIDNLNKKYKGELLCYHPQYLNIILMTEKEKIIVKNPSVIRRAREIDANFKPTDDKKK